MITYRYPKYSCIGWHALVYAGMRWYAVVCVGMRLLVLPHIIAYILEAEYFLVRTTWFGLERITQT